MPYLGQCKPYANQTNTLSPGQQTNNTHTQTRAQRDSYSSVSGLLVRFLEQRPVDGRLDGGCILVDSRMKINRREGNQKTKVEHH